MATPQITLHVSLNDLSGVQAGSLADPAKVRVTLCGFGPNLPRIPGTAMIAQPGPVDYLFVGAAANIILWANDQIQPSGTFYSIEILDGDDNVVQCGAYIFNGSGTIELSSAPQIVPPYGVAIALLALRNVTGAYPGTVYDAPGPVILVVYNGAILDPNASPTPDYTLSANNTRITTAFATQSGDKIWALTL